MAVGLSGPIQLKLVRETNSRDVLGTRVRKQGEGEYPSALPCLKYLSWSNELHFLWQV